MKFILFLKKSFFAKAAAAMLACCLSVNLAANSSNVAKNYSDVDPGTYKNVILFIGDGMGYNHLKWTESSYDTALQMLTSTPYHGYSQTRSSSNAVTDSAAGGTALACAVRTTNGCIGVFPQDMFGLAYVPMNLCEYAHSVGKLSGVVTTDKNCGATPGTFSAHVFNRGQEEEITRQQIEESQLDLIWGAASGYVDDEYASDNGWALLDSKADFVALTEGTRSFGQFEGDLWNDETGADSPNLSEMTVKAIDMLDDDADGFFLMVEGAHIDKHSHNNEAEKMKKAVLEFNAAIDYAIRYAKTNGDTLIVISADHETGKIIVKEDGTYTYTQTSHSSTDVPLLVYGSDTFIKADEAIMNKELSRRLAMALGAQADEFPKAVNVAA